MMRIGGRGGLREAEQIVRDLAGSADLVACDHVCPMCRVDLRDGPHGAKCVVSRAKAWIAGRAA